VSSLADRELVATLETDRVKWWSRKCVDGVFLNHPTSRDNEDLISIPQGPTGLEAADFWWPDARPFVSIRADPGGRPETAVSWRSPANELREREERSCRSGKWAWASSLVEAMARLPRIIGRGRALEVLLSSAESEAPMPDSTLRNRPYRMPNWTASSMHSQPDRLVDKWRSPHQAPRTKQPAAHVE